MKWTEVKVETASEAVEAISNIMMEAGASGVAPSREWQTAFQAGLFLW